MKLYHYTDSAALIGIFEHKKLWLNDVNFMNDSNELFDAVHILGRVGGELQSPLYVQLANTISSLRQHPPQMMHFFFNGFFITSFCEEDNLLEMWRGYGANGQKFSIEFDSEALLQQANIAVPEGDFSIEKCLYKVEDKIAAMKSFLDTNPHPNTLEVKEGSYQVNIETKWLMQFFRLALTFKNSGFESEKEYRMIGKIDDIHILKHRVNNFGITPYFELPLCMPCISSCRIGPTQDRSLVTYSLASLCKKSVSSGDLILIEQDEHGNQSQLTVNYSDTSFRQM